MGIRKFNKINGNFCKKCTKGHAFFKNWPFKNAHNKKVCQNQF